MKTSIGQTKVEMAVDMMRRAVRRGINANYAAAVAWFGSKELMRTALSPEMAAILRMKRNKLQSRVNTGRETQLLDAKEIYQLAGRKQ